jgi:hypothetical protein
MDLRDLVRALLDYDALSARVWLTEARRAAIVWSSIPVPPDLTSTELALAAGVVEMMALREGVAPPGWTATIGGSPTRIYLVRSAAEMPRLRRLCEEEGPEPLRRRGLLAPPDFLDAA